MGFTQLQEPYLYVVVRKDLSTPQKAVQACHAVFEAVSAKSFKPPQVHPNIIICEVPDERRLVQFAEKLEKAGVRCALFQEADRGDEYTSLATEIVYGDRRSLFKNLQLMQERKCACEMVEDYGKSCNAAYEELLEGESDE